MMRRGLEAVMRGHCFAMLIVAGLVALSPIFAAADEMVETTDGRKLLLRSDGIYEFQSKLDPVIMQRALAIAKEWAQDQTLILYCLRKAPNRDLLARGTLKDRDEALARLRRGGATEQQLRQVAVAITEAFRVTPPDGEDRTMDAACVARDVERSVQMLREIAWPLYLRPPFDQLK